MVFHVDFGEHAAKSYNRVACQYYVPTTASAEIFIDFLGNSSLFDQFQLAIQSAKGCIHV